jgi:hypothetical protein
LIIVKDFKNLKWLYCSIAFISWKFILKRYLKILGLLIITGMLVFALARCGGGDGDGGGTIGFDFTPGGNESVALSLAKNTMAFYPIFSEIGYEAIDILVSADPNNSPYMVALCANATIGSATLSWDDTDSNLEISSGDSATIDVINCDLDNSETPVSGQIIFTFSVVDIDNLPRQLELSIAFNISINDLSGDIVVTGKFGAITQTTNDANYTYTYVAQDVADEVISITRVNDQSRYMFGCYTVVHAFDIGAPDTYDLAIAGVINSQNYIMSFEDGPPFTFINNLPYSGKKKLLSQSDPNCASVGAPNDVSSTNGMYMVFEGALSTDGWINATIFDANDVWVTEFMTRWEDI